MIPISYLANFQVQCIKKVKVALSFMVDSVPLRWKLHTKHELSPYKLQVKEALEVSKIILTIAIALDYPP